MKVLIECDENSDGDIHIRILNHEELDIDDPVFQQVQKMFTIFQEHLEYEDIPFINKGRNMTATEVLERERDYYRKCANKLKGLVNDI